MSGRLFIVGSGLVALVAACSTPYGQTPRDLTDDDTSGATTTTAKPRAPQSSAASDGASGGGAGHADGGAGAGGAAPSPGAPAHCPSTNVAGVRGWTPPGPSYAACSSADITYFAQTASVQGLLASEMLMETRNPDCRACIFSRDTDAWWRLVIYLGAEGTRILNIGACFARAPGGSEACGRAVFAFDDCLTRACDVNACGSVEAAEACYNSESAAAACAAYSPVATCGGAQQLTALQGVCFSPTDSARVLCAAGY